MGWGVCRYPKLIPVDSRGVLRLVFDIHPNLIATRMGFESNRDRKTLLLRTCAIRAPVRANEKKPHRRPESSMGRISTG